MTEFQINFGFPLDKTLHLLYSIVTVLNKVTNDNNN